jgi:hypothetical protein
MLACSKSSSEVVEAILMVGVAVLLVETSCIAFACIASLIVHLPFGGVREDLIGARLMKKILVNLSKFFLGLGSGVLVRMIFLSKFIIGFLDFLGVCSFTHPQQF